MLMFTDVYGEITNKSHIYNGKTHFSPHVLGFDGSGI